MQGLYDHRSGTFKVEIEISGTTPGFTKKIWVLFDTGHSGTLSLPIVDLIAVGAKLKSAEKVMYANGYPGVVYDFEVNVCIDGKPKPIIAGMIENPGAGEGIAGVQLFDPFMTLIDFKNKTIGFYTEEEIIEMAKKEEEARKKGESS